eukprot:TRINITY_DN49005_c0_g1_i1.p1 TRINITY_DN49005_c0_g1~~TRINITY_DN49005_c0_g1_i1.p1  ORF type:complete len:730 (+),score=102.52 TRINITY_DN49005_c0_g1_i1:36-2225(+)
MWHTFRQTLSLISLSICAVESGLAASLSAGRLGYQLHSANDLEEWAAFSKKGGRSFKVDPHFVNAATCYLNGVTPTHGCFLLSHDYPVPYISRNTYNTTKDLTSLVARADEIFPRGSYVRIALCFKTTVFKISLQQMCSGSTSAARHFLTYVDEFFEQAQAAVAKAAASGIIVEFVLDGFLLPEGCLANRWRPWKSVWVEGRAPDDAFTSNNVTLGYDRYQILNNPEDLSRWKHLATAGVHYGKFQNSSYPYQLWEPDAQADFFNYEDAYLSGGAGLHKAGYDFAINVDPVLWQTYSATRTKAAYNFCLNCIGAQKDGVIEPGSRPAIAALQMSEDLAAVVTAWVDKSSSKVTGRIWTLRQLFVEPSSNDLIAANFPNTSLIDATIAANSGRSLPIGLKAIRRGDRQSFWLLLTAGSSFQLYHARFASEREVLQLEPVKGGRLELEPAEEPLSTSLYEDSNGDAQLVSLVRRLSTDAQTAPGSCHLGLRHHLEKSSFYCFDQAGDNHESGDLLVHSKTESEFHVLAVTATTSANTYVGSAILPADVSFSTKPRLHQARAGVGRFPRLSSTAGLHPSTSSTVLAVNDGGYCQNSHGHNTQSFPRVCKAADSASSAEYVLDYTYGDAEDWEEQVQRASKNSDEHLFSSCNPELLHGTFHLGSRPSGDLVVLNGIPTSLSVHEGFPEGAQDIGKCGKPLPLKQISSGAIMVEGWPLWGGKVPKKPELIELVI